MAKENGKNNRGFFSKLGKRRSRDQVTVESPRSTAESRGTLGATPMTPTGAEVHVDEDNIHSSVFASESQIHDILQQDGEYAGAAVSDNGSTFEEDRVQREVDPDETVGTNPTIDLTSPDELEAPVRTPSPTSVKRNGRGRSDTGRRSPRGHNKKVRPPVVGILQLYVGDGFDLVAADANGYSDPFCKIKFQDQKKYTQVKKMTLAPQWSENFFFNVYEGESTTVHITVYDKDRVGRDFLGECSFDAESGDKAISSTLILENITKGRITVKSYIHRENEYIQKFGPLVESGITDKEAKAAASTTDFKAWLTVDIIRGVDLAARDKSGKSDPYVKIKAGPYNARTKFIPANLDPVWQERLHLPVILVSNPLYLQVVDYDVTGNHDNMGHAMILVRKLRPGTTYHMRVPLLNVERGLLEFTVTLNGDLNVAGGLEQDINQIHKLVDMCGKGVTVSQAIRRDDKGRVRRAMDATGSSMTGNFAGQQSSLALSVDDTEVRLEPQPLAKQDTLADLKPLSQDDDVIEWPDPEPATETILGSGSHEASTVPPTLSDDEDEQKTPLVITGLGEAFTKEVEMARTPEQIAKIRYREAHAPLLSKKRFQRLTTMSRPMGMLRTRILGFQVPARFQAKAFVSVDLGKAHRRTSEYGKRPAGGGWNETLFIPMTDLYDVFHLRVMWHDLQKTTQGHHTHLIGQLKIPVNLLANGVRKFVLKDETMMKTLPDMSITIRVQKDLDDLAGFTRSMVPKSPPLMDKPDRFKLALLKRNTARVSSVINGFKDTWAAVKDLWAWKDHRRSIISLALFEFFFLFFRMWFVPAAMVIFMAYTGKQILMTKNTCQIQCCMESLRARQSVVDVDTQDSLDSASQDESTTEDPGDFRSEDSESTPTITESTTKVMTISKFSKNAKKFGNNVNVGKQISTRLQKMESVLYRMQTLMDQLAGFCERIKNIVLFTNRELSLHFMLWLSIATIVLMFIPLNYLIALWGANKWTKYWRKRRKDGTHVLKSSPNRLLHFIMRSMTDIEVVQFAKELDQTMPAPPGLGIGLAKVREDDELELPGLEVEEVPLEEGKWASQESMRSNTSTSSKPARGNLFHRIHQRHQQKRQDQEVKKNASKEAKRLSAEMNSLEAPKTVKAE
eukprot:Clim_evm20s23 gene=Clim_evmTU20s23